MNVKELQAKFKQLAKDVYPTAEEFRMYANILNEERASGMKMRKGWDGSTFARLKLKTVLQKQKGGTTTKWKQNRAGNKFAAGGTMVKTKVAPASNPSAPLIHTGDLMNATSGSDKNHGFVRLAKSRSEDIGGENIGSIHEKGLGKNLPARHHWGIYAQARRRIERAHNIKIARLVKNL